MTSISFKTKSQPHFVISNQRKYLFIGQSVLVPNYQELFIIFQQLSHILTKQRKRGIRYYNICFFQKFNTLVTTEITITL